MELCNDIFDCVDNASVEKESSFNYEDYDGIVKTTQISQDYYNDGESIGFELADDGKCKKYCSQCDEAQNCIKCAPRYKKDSTGKNCIDLIENCVNYDSNLKCTSCKENYALVEDGDINICKLISEIDSKYFITSVTPTIYKKCSSEINNCLNCRKISGVVNCDTCFDGYGKVDKIVENPFLGSY